MNASWIGSSSIPIIELSSWELASRKIDPDHILIALESLHNNGICVLKNAVDTLALDRLNERMTVDAHAIKERDEALPNFGRATGNIQVALPLASALLSEDIIANPFAISIVECVLGPNPVLRFQSGNAAFKADEQQPVHIDIDYEYPKLPFGMCININLVAVSPQNGATEFWPGSHVVAPSLVPPGIVSPHHLQRQRDLKPPLQFTLPKGSLIIRDLRIWHAGMPNMTDNVRITLIGMHFPNWYRSEQRVLLPRGLKDDERIRWGSLVPAVEWVEEEAAPRYFSFSSVAPIRTFVR